MILSISIMHRGACVNQRTSHCKLLHTIRVSNPGMDYQSRDFVIGAVVIPAGIGITKFLYSRFGQSPSAANMTCLTVQMGGLFNRQFIHCFLTLILLWFSDGAVCQLWAAVNRQLKVNSVGAFVLGLVITSIRLSLTTVRLPPVRRAGNEEQRRNGE